MASSSSSSSSPPSKAFDVFLSFRGEDTRRGFTGHLFEALNSKGIRTFIDNKSLESGDNIGDNLSKAIEGSSICIPIFSTNYATSRWCLMELAKMVECGNKIIIIPVFYNVNPSQVRKQEGPFEKAFVEYEQSPAQKHMVDKWRKALTHVGELKGFDLDNDADGYEASFIQLIVKKVLGMLENVPLHLAGHLFGIDSRVEEIMKLLSIEERDVRMIGMVGIGGIGKTTLSKVVYNKIFKDYEFSEFLSDVRERSKGAGGLASLQQMLIRAIQRDDVEIKDTDVGKMMIIERFSHKKVLIVVDDVDKKDQPEALAGETKWFGQGSRIIITTRDEHVLNVHGLTKEQIYRPNELSHDDSLQLFSHNAFGKSRPTEDYMDLSTKIVSTTGGLPLALEVTGSFLFDKRDPVEWQELLQDLKGKTLIQDRLRISYDELSDDQKMIFLDIACFFIGYEKDHVIATWKGCGLKANLALNILLHRSLIKMDEGDKFQFQMHDQIRDMGRGIVSEKYPRDHGMQSRLWNADTVLDVLAHCKGSKHVEGINLDQEETREPFNTKSFKAMTDLRILRASYATIKGNFKEMPTQLRFLEWRYCPLKSLPNNFNLEKIVVLDLSDSHRLTHLWRERSKRGFEKTSRVVRGLWRGTCLPEKIFDSLKILNLSYCNLKATPDFSSCPNLERLYLVGCESLVKVHESICHMKALRDLDLSDTSIRRLPASIGHMKALRDLNLSCTSIEELHGWFVQIELKTMYQHH